MRNIRDIVLWGRKTLKNKGIESYSLDTDLIIAHVLGKEKSFLYAYPEYEISRHQIGRIKKNIRLRGQRIPIAYILKAKEFYGIELFIDKGVFSPRPETEILVSAILDVLNRDFNGKEAKIYEIGLGSGAISVALAMNSINTIIFGCDINKKAISISKKNILRYNLSKRINIFRSSDFTGVKKGCFDIIVSNPPYLSLKDYLEAEKEVRKEPKNALISREKGLFLIKRIIREGRNYLRNNKGYILIEIGHGQGELLKEYSKRQGLEAEIIKDYADKERVLKIKI